MRQSRYVHSFKFDQLMSQRIVLARNQVRELFARTRCRADFRYGRMFRRKIMEN
jgi:hypothetical protein